MTLSFFCKGMIAQHVRTAAAILPCRPARPNITSARLPSAQTHEMCPWSDASSSRVKNSSTIWDPMQRVQSSSGSILLNLIIAHDITLLRKWYSRQVSFGIPTWSYNLTINSRMQPHTEATVTVFPHARSCGKHEHRQLPSEFL